jgi:hypothetical protein
MSYTAFALRVDLTQVDEPHVELPRILMRIQERLDRGDEEGHIVTNDGIVLGAWALEDDLCPTTSDVQQYLSGPAPAGQEPAPTIQKYL